MLANLLCEVQFGKQTEVGKFEFLQSVDSCCSLFALSNAKRARNPPGHGWSLRHKECATGIAVDGTVRDKSYLTGSTGVFRMVSAVVVAATRRKLKMAACARRTSSLILVAERTSSAERLASSC